VIAAAAFSFEVFSWGAVGALFAAVVTLVIPAGVALAKEDNKQKIMTRNVAYGSLIVGLAYGLAGGITASKIGHADNGNDAFFYGMAWESLFAGAMKAGRAAAAGPSTA
jgi:hypothetical protein